MTFAGSALKILLMRRSIGPDSSSPARTTSRQLAYLGILIYTVCSHSTVATIVARRRDGNSNLPSIRITPIGFESLGVRSMCTFVETPDVKLLIDAGVALGPRFRKLPHPREYQARNECRSRIRTYAAKADAIVVSHYHNDHHTPNYTETVWVGSSPEEAEQIYKDKLVLVKDIRNYINFNQRRRGWMFQRFIKRTGGKCEVADGRSFEFGSTKITLSQPVPHGEDNSEMGWVLMTRIRCGEETFLHASDVQGPMSKETLRLILKDKPSILVLGGPPIYLKGVRVQGSSIERGIMNAAKIAKTVPTVILEHHILRSENWKAEAGPVLEAANEADNMVVTAAGYLNQPALILEARRQDLYTEEKPSPEFVKWMELPRDKRQLKSPPI